MSDLIFTANIVLPLFLLIAVGFFAKSIRLVDEGFSKSANNLSFKCFLPILLFYNIYSCDLSATVDSKLMIFAAIGSTLSVLVAIPVMSLIEKDNPKRGTMIQAIFRSNFLLFATPICAAIFPENGAAMASLVSIVVIPIQNIGSVVVLSIFGSKEKPSIKKTIINIFKNPFIISSFLGLVFALLKIKLPVFLDKALSNIATMATPFALVMLGTELQMRGFRNDLKQVVIATLGKLLITPAVMLSIAILLGFSGTPFAVLLALYSAPTAVTSYIMAKGAGCDGDLAAECVVSTSFFAVFSVFILIYLSKVLGLI